MQPTIDIVVKYILQLKQVIKKSIEWGGGGMSLFILATINGLPSRYSQQCSTPTRIYMRKVKTIQMKRAITF